MSKVDKRFDSKDVVTINTDASFDLKKSTGGYGIWIKSDFFTIKKWGKFKESITDSNEAEIKALVNALYLLKQNKEIFRLVIINTDSKTVQGIIINKRFRKEGTKLLDLLKDYSKVRVKHVQGHKTSYNSRQYVNN